MKREYNKIGIGTSHLYKKDYSAALAFFSDVFSRIPSSAPEKILIDTAEVYGSGASEITLSKLIKDASIPRTRMYLASKVSPEHLSKKELIESCKSSLKRLRCNYIDLYQLHWSHPSTNVSDTFEALESLRAQGYIRHIGVCNFTLSLFARLIFQYNIECLQAEYNLNNLLLERTHLPLCKANHIQVIAYSPFDRGFIRFNKRLDVLKPIAEKLSKTINQIMLAYLMQEDVVSCIPETTNISHYVEALDSCILLDQVDMLTIRNAFMPQVIFLAPSSIEITRPNSHTCLVDALTNTLHEYPSPVELAKDIRTYGLLKPIKVKPAGNHSALVEGAARYWAHCIAYGERERIPCIVVSEE